MLRKMDDKNRKRIKRKFHIRKRIHGTQARPRLTVFRSNCNLYAQVIDDDNGKTLAAISTLEKEFAALKPNKAGAEKLGEAMGARLDRNGYLYHGVIKALADSTRKAGIEF